MFAESSSLAIVRESREMDAGRQRASNDKVLDGDLIANCNSSTKHKKGLVAENKRLFLPVPREYSDPRDCSIAGENGAAAFNLHVYSPIYRVEPLRINSIEPMRPVRGGHLESRACAHRYIDTAITEGKRARIRATHYIISLPT